MRYSRLAAVVVLTAAIGLAAAVALGRSAQPGPATPLHRALQQAAQQFLAVPRPVTPPRLMRVLPAPLNGGTTCFVATSCSIRPCVIPVATAVVPVPVLPNAGTRCPLGDRTPKALRVSAPTLSATPR